MKQVSARSIPSVLARSGLATLLLCSCTAHYSLRAFDDLARTGGFRTIVLGERLSLYSPEEPVLAQEFVTLIEKERGEVFALFGVDTASPTLVLLHPNEGMGMDARIEGDRMTVDRIRMSPDGGFLGLTAGNEIVVEVAPQQTLERADGSPFISTFGALTYRDTIRHELAHVAMSLLGARVGDWLGEGIAHAVEWIPVEDGRFVLDPLPESLRQAAGLPRGLREIGELLAWKQSFPPVERDPPARLLAHSLVVFLIEREGAPSLREGLLRVAAYPPARIRAAQDDWSAWLDGLAPAP